MNRFAKLILSCICFALLSSVRFASADDAVLSTRAANAYGKLPLSFVENCGQLDKQVRYVIRGPRASAFFRSDGVTFDLWDSAQRAESRTGDSPDEPMGRLGVHGFSREGGNDLPAALDPDIRTHSVLKLTFENADPSCRVEGMDELPGKVNYLVGKDSSKWHTDIPTFKGVAYRDVWPGIDVLYRGDRRQLKYDIRINPGADPKDIRLKYQGAEKIWLDRAGDLHIKTAVTEFAERVPGVYQEKNGERIPIKGGYVLLDRRTIGFRADDVNSNLPLVIDPASDLVYSTFLGGRDTDEPYAIAVDSSGCAYVTGNACSSDYPVTPGAFQAAFGGSGIYYGDAFVTKLNASGSALIYSTFIGGSDCDSGYGVAVDSSGCAYVTGHTYSDDFPVTSGSPQTTFGGGTNYVGDGFVTKLNASGSALEYSTFLGGTGDDSSQGIAVDSSGCAYVTGGTRSSNFPVTPGAFQRTYRLGDAFVTKLNASGSAFVYSTFLGGSGQNGDGGSDIAVDSSGCVYVTGGTCSSDFPVTTGASQTVNRVAGDVFVTKFSVSGSTLVYSICLGGIGGDVGYRIALDSSNCAYVAGYTISDDFPVTPGAFQTSIGDSSHADAFVTKMNASGALVYSTFLGGSDVDDAYGIAVDSSGCACVTGDTYSSDFPATPGALKTSYGGSHDGFVSKLNASGSALVYSSFLGSGNNDACSGIALDSADCAYVTGYTFSLDFPVTSEAFQTSFGGYRDVFVSKLSTDAIPLNVSLSPTSGTIQPSAKTTFTSSCSDADGYADLSYCSLLLNQTAGISSNSVYARYDAVNNLLYLRDDAGTSWLGGFAPGSANIIENSQCKLYCAETTKVGSVGTLTVNWKIELKPSMLDKTLVEWLYVCDKDGRTDGWDRMGGLVVGAPPANISLALATENWTHAVKRQVSCQYSDTDGYGDIAYAFLLVNRTYGSGANSVYAVYNQKVNLLYLRNDANTGWIGGFAPGSAGTMENAECKIFCADTTVTGSGNNLTVNWSILPKSGMIGTGWMEWLSVTDKANLSDGWDHYGTVNVQ